MSANPINPHIDLIPSEIRKDRHFELLQQRYYNKEYFDVPAKYEPLLAKKSELQAAIDVLAEELSDMQFEIDQKRELCDQLQDAYDDIDIPDDDDLESEWEAWEAQQQTQFEIEMSA